jgi:two-component system response regulator FixJ
MRFTSSTAQNDSYETPPRVFAEHQVARLSPRERQVLDGLIEGLGNKAIAFKLGISPRTVEIYRANMMSKLHARHLVDVLQLAFAAGLLRPYSGDPARREAA